MSALQIESITSHGGAILIFHCAHCKTVTFILDEKNAPGSPPVEFRLCPDVVEHNFTPIANPIRWKRLVGLFQRMLNLS